MLWILTWCSLRSRDPAVPSQKVLGPPGAVSNTSPVSEGVCKYLQNTVTKFSASASVVADPEEAKNALTPIAEEVIKAFTATLGTLLSISSGAGASLAKELQESGRQLTEALDALGSAVCTGHLATCAAKVLEYAASLEQSSTKNRAALMRRLLKSLSQLRDANREMQEELDGGSTAVDITSGDEELLDDEDDLVMPPMDPSERQVCGTGLWSGWNETRLQWI
ncbi:unnamed protein product [Durusdinium trenchii]|uniref:Cyclin-D1-binding protein 1-like N-terminal domain-containing protein n=1 Tax=Durusdinium trenchii TaxID=1381693 RepID=A0ABP0SVF0_9DINO